MTAGAAAGIVGALAALAVFAWPTADGRLDRRDATRQAGATDSPTTRGAAGAADASEGPATSTSPVSEPAGSRRLVTLTPSTGIGSARTQGDDLVLDCPSNQSDDRYRELRYELLAPYSALAAAVSVSGPGDPDATAAVQVFIQRREDRSDRVVEVERAVTHAGEVVPVSAPVAGAAAIVLRVTCALPGQQVTVKEPTLTR